MSKVDDDVLRLYQQIKALESKVDKLSKLSERIQKVEAYITALDKEFKTITSYINEFALAFSPALDKLEQLGSIVAKGLIAIQEKLLGL